MKRKIIRLELDVLDKEGLEGIQLFCQRLSSDRQRL